MSSLRSVRTSIDEIRSMEVIHMDETALREIEDVIRRAKARIRRIPLVCSECANELHIESRYAYCLYCGKTACAQMSTFFLHSARAKTLWRQKIGKASAPIGCGIARPLKRPGNVLAAT